VRDSCSMCDNDSERVYVNLSEYAYVICIVGVFLYVREREYFCMCVYVFVCAFVC
jgi:hypothetical protein